MSESQRPDPPLRDPVVDAAWKAHSTELPPPRVDAAILAAAHREAGSRPRAMGDGDELAEARAPSRAWWGFAAAATIGAIAFGVVQMTPPPAAPDAPLTASDLPAVPATKLRENAPSSPPAPAIASDPAPSAPPAAPVSKASDKREPARERQLASPPPATDKLTAAAPAAPAAMPPPAQLAGSVAPAQDAAPASAAVPAAPRAFPAEPARKQESDAMARAPVAQDRGDARALAKEAEALAPAAPLTRAAAPSADTAMARADEASARVEGKRRDAAAPTATLAPEAWVARIVALMDAGRSADAARELRAFRDAFPDADARLPARLRDWAAAVRREP